MHANENAQLLCQHRTKAGHHCHMPLSAGHPSLCAHHLRIAKREATRHAENARYAESTFTQAQEGRQSAEATFSVAKEDIAAALLNGASDLNTAVAVNLFLGNLLKQVAHNRVSRKNAIAMAYISQLLLNSISVMHREARDAQAAAAAKAEEPQGFIINAIRPCRRPHVHESDNLSAAADIRASDAMSREQALKYARPNHSASAVVAAPFREPSQSPSLPLGGCGERGESLDSHPTNPSPITAPPVVDDKSRGCHSEQSEESAFPRASADPTPPPHAPHPAYQYTPGGLTPPPQAPHPRANTVLYTPDDPPPFGQQSSAPIRSVAPRGRLSLHRRYHHGNFSQNAAPTRLKHRLSPAPVSRGLASRDWHRVVLRIGDGIALQYTRGAI